MSETIELVSLADVCEINPKGAVGLPRDTEVTFVPMAAVDEKTGTIQSAEVRRYGDVAKGYTVFRDKDVLFAKITPCMENGKIAIANNLQNGWGFGSTEFHILRTSNQIIPEWIYYFLRQEKVRRFAASKMTGTAGQQRVPKSIFEKLRIPVLPISAQQQIAAILEKADAAREKRRQANQLTEQFLQSAFLETFGDPATNPKRWEKKQLSDLAYEIHPGSTPKEELDAFADEGIIFLRSENILNKKVKISENQRYIKVQLYDDFPRLQVKNEDVLINIIGASIGRCTVFDGNLGKALLNQNICLIRCNDNLLPNYLCNYFLTDYCQGFFKGTGRGGAQYALNAKILADLKVPCPPLSEQQRFAVLVEKVEFLRAKQRQSAQELEHLFHSLMQRAFRGELVKE